MHVGFWWVSRTVDDGSDSSGRYESFVNLISVWTETMKDGCGRDESERELTHEATIRLSGVVPLNDAKQRSSISASIENTAMLSEFGVANVMLCFLSICFAILSLRWATAGSWHKQG